MLRRRWAFTHFVAIVVGILGLTADAHAYEEQAAVELSLGYVGLAANDTLPVGGPTLDVSGALGISDWLVVRAGFGYAALLDSERTVHAGRGRLELAYLVDVLQWVPFFGVGGGLWGYEGENGFGLRPAGHLLFGLDYLASRRWTVGLDIRTGGLLQPGDIAWYTEGQLRFGRMFELF